MQRGLKDYQPARFVKADLLVVSMQRGLKDLFQHLLRPESSLRLNAKRIERRERQGGDQKKERSLNAKRIERYICYRSICP